MVLVVNDLDVLVPVVEDRVTLGEVQPGKGVRVARQLLLDLFDVVVVDVAITGRSR
jgi:hypothetical protein